MGIFQPAMLVYQRVNIYHNTLSIWWDLQKICFRVDDQRLETQISGRCLYGARCKSLGKPNWKVWWRRGWAHSSLLGSSRLLYYDKTSWFFFHLSHGDYLEGSCFSSIIQRHRAFSSLPPNTKHHSVKNDHPSLSPPFFYMSNMSRPDFPPKLHQYIEIAAWYSIPIHFAANSSTSFWASWYSRFGFKTKSPQNLWIWASCAVVMNLEPVVLCFRHLGDQFVVVDSVEGASDSGSKTIWCKTQSWHSRHLFFRASFIWKKVRLYWQRKNWGPPSPKLTPPKKRQPKKKSDFFLFKGNIGGTVDGQNPAPPRMMIIPLFLGF